MEALVCPVRLWSREEVLKTDAVPLAPGVYAWWFREIPPNVPTDGCVIRDGRTLLYVGIVPKEPPKAGDRPPSSATLRSRIRQHMQGNAYGSTLRLTLGCLLAESLGIELTRVGNGKRLTFGKGGESLLSAWMGENAFVCWKEREQPWLMESEIIRSVCLSVNFDQNQQHPYWPTLRACRASARERARSLPVAE